MYLYYTNPTEPEVEQSKSQLSLGGYKSSIRVDSGKINNLFSDITPMSVSNYNQNRYVGLVLKNELGSDKTALKLWFDFPENCYSLFKIAAVDMVLDSNNSLQMEHIQTVSSKPLYADFYEADGELNAVDLGDLANGEQIGLWIEMSLLIDTIKDSYSNVYKQDPNNSYRYLEVEKETLDDIGLHISWTD